MGTRHLTAVFYDGAYRIAQYGQWDGYPDGQGTVALDFLQKMDREKFLAQLKKTRFLTPEEKKDAWRAAGAKEDEPFVGMDVVAKYQQQFPLDNRDHGAKILQLVQDAEGDEILLDDALQFAGDSLFCEWAYVIDFDKNTFEVYKGFNEKPLDPNERFAKIRDQLEKQEGYQPVRLARAWKLDELPTEKEFLIELKEKDEDEVEPSTIEKGSAQVAKLMEG